MICNKCGAEINDNTTFCTSCGAQVTPAAPAQPYQAEAQPQAPYQAPYQAQPQAPAKTAKPGNGLAIAGLILGIVSFLCFPAITGTLGIIFGAVAKSKGNTSGMATAGIVCGAIGVALWLIMLIACSGSAGLLSAMGM